MLIQRVEIRLVELPLSEPFATSHGTTTSRRLVVVRLETDAGFGWGECSALPEPTYTDEFASGAFVALDEQLAPRLLGVSTTVDQGMGRLDDVVGHPMAKAAVEMALLDARLRADGCSLAAHLGVEATHVRAGAAVGMGPRQAVVSRVAELAALGFGRVKVKIGPAGDVDVIEAVVKSNPSIEVQVDANGSYGSEHLERLLDLSRSGIRAIEQPFAATNRSAAAALVEGSPIPIVADESAESLAVVEDLRADGALSGVSIKPPRLGGLMPAMAIHDWCLANALPATAGGMLECGLGRHALAAVAGLPGFTLTGDLSPAGRWLAADPWPDLIMEAGTVEVPDGPGVAPEPDEELLAHYTVRSSDLTSA